MERTKIETKKDVKELMKLTANARSSDVIASELYEKFKVYKALRDENGNGVVTGLTNISEIKSFKKNEDGTREGIRGELYYRGIRIEDLIDGFVREKRFGFEEVAYLLLTGSLPNAKELADFNSLLNHYRALPLHFTRDVILKAPPQDMMNALARSVLTLYSYDPKAEDTSIENVFRQCVELIAQFPLIAVYAYRTYYHYYKEGNLSIRNPKARYSTAENILYMLKGSDKFTTTEARLLDVCLVLHMEHGGGNNSTFTTRVVTSSGTDTYSAVAAALGSLKGPRHGGANIKVVRMVEDMKEHVSGCDDKQIEEYLNNILEKKAFDNTGLIYGVGHAIYSVSDPRAEILKKYLKEIKNQGNCDEEFLLYEKIYRLAPELIAKKRRIYKGVTINIDFYTGYIYKSLKIPTELYTAIFAIARIVGWSAHRIEEIVNQGKIIRPAYVAVGERRDYKSLSERK